MFLNFKNFLFKVPHESYKVIAVDECNNELEVQEIIQEIIESTKNVEDELHKNFSTQNVEVSHVDDHTSNSASFDDLFCKIWENINIVEVPSGWVHYTSTSCKRWIAFSIFDTKNEATGLNPLPQKLLLLTEEGNY